MYLLDYEIIGTGSKGNAVRINNIMIDAGLPFQKLKEALYHVDYLFYTHSHSDHLKEATYKRIRKMFPNIIMFANPYVSYLVDVDHIIQPDKTFDLEDGTTVTPFEGEHDVPVLGYTFILDDGTKIIYATDTNTLEHAPDEKFDYLFLEANYDVKKLKAIIESGANYGYDYAAGAERHLSKQDSKKYYYTHRANKDSVYIPLHMSARFY